MQLQDFYDNFKLASDLNNDERLNWVYVRIPTSRALHPPELDSNLDSEQTLWLAECFLQQFGELVPFLTDEFIEAILDAVPTSPQLRAALSLMRRLIEAYSINSDGALRVSRYSILN
jgi:hypothetical protein